MQINHSRRSLRPRFHLPSRFALAALALGVTVTFSRLPDARAAEAPRSSDQAADQNSFRLFYDKLADDGDWFQTNDYGYVFQPRAATQDKAWRPYTDGYWAQTEAGWAWISNEDFGWACYHYGRWANLVDTGWVWIPGTDWAPSYVSWRMSKDHKHVGWAPLPPEARVTKSVAIEGWVDSAYDVGPDAYVFIDTNRFGDDSYRSHLLPAEQTVTIFVETENVTRIDYRTVGSRSVLYSGGPDVVIIRESGGRPVRELRLETRSENVEFFERGDRRRFTEVNGSQLVVVTAAPEVITSTSIRISQPARINRRLDSFTVDRGYQGIRDPQQVDRIRASVRSQSPRPPAQVERDASAALHRNAPAESAERNKQPDRQQPANGTPRNEANPSATASPTPVREQTKPEASPTATPVRNAAGSPTPKPATSPVKGESEHQGGKGTPAPTLTPHASATPGNNRETRDNKHPEGAPTPKEKGERGTQTERSASPKPEAPTPAASRHANERTENKPSDSETNRNRPERQETPRHEEKPRTGEADEKKATPARTEPQTSTRRPSEESKERTTENSGKERSERKESPTAPAAEKEKQSPKP